MKDTQQGFKSPTSSKLSQSQAQPSFKKYNSLQTEEKRLTSSSIISSKSPTEKKPNYGRSQADRVQESTVGLSKSSVVTPKGTVGRSSVNQKSSNEMKLRNEEIEAKRELKSLEQKLTILKSRIKSTK